MKGLKTEEGNENGISMGEKKATRQKNDTKGKA
jgi:hypothetical protein